MSYRPPLPLIALGAAAALLAGCSSTEKSGQSGDVPLVEDGKLLNCTGLPYKPFEFEDKKSGDIVGFDIELMDLVAEELDVEQEVIDTPFEGIESGAVFASNKCDLSAAGMTITEERQQKFAFSDPYFEATQALATKKGSGFDSLESLKGERLGVQMDTTGQMYAEDNADGVEVKDYEDLGLQLQALEGGQITAAINDNGVLYDWVKERPEFEVSTEFDTGEQYGIGVGKDDKELLKVINDVLAKAKDDGTYDRIYKKWFGEAPR
ncbi:basic amino acid ABC transporter substrate-binding protein [Streptomyces synnematoformans]|uniref:Basic amino acid ABC transporter substrate-binding protein n=1 Tax=Streptomyces synnematoformans TaxID=415721 RepID=A0ABP4KIU2_9ACTN